MALSGWGVSLLLLLQGFLIRDTLAARAIHVEFSKPLADNSTDDFLLPLVIGENDAKQTVYLAPSTSNAHTFAISPKACTPPGNNTAWPGCVKYRGGVFDSTKSSFKPGSGDLAKLDWRNDQYTLFASGAYGQDTITLSDKAGDVQSKDFEIGLVDACNMTSGFLGLGPNSTLLERLYKDGKIESRSYGLHVGIDITNYPYPVFDPTFDTGEKPKEESDYNSGIGKRSRITERAEGKPKEVHSFAGGLTLGGYDRSRIDNRTASLTVPLSADGLLELELTELIVINSWMVNDSPAHDLFNETRKVIIDSSTPYMYLPDKTADALSYSMEAYYGDPMVDFFYGSNPDKYLGNVTFTLQAPGGSESIKIVVPPSVFQQPIGMLRDYQPVGDEYYDYYMPIKQFKASSKQPIILGRSFLKAAYLFVNHERKNFHISQVAYTGAPHDIISVSASDSGDYGSGTSSTSSGTGSGQNPSPGTETRRPPAGAIASAAAGAFLISLIAFLIWRRRNMPKQTHLHTIPSNPSFHENELEGGHALVQLPANSIEKPPVAASSPYSNDTKTGWHSQPQPGHYEMGSDIGTAVSPCPARGYPQQSVPGYAELATPLPTQQQPYQAGGVQGRYEMM